MNRNRLARGTGSALLLAAALSMTGCDECWEGDCYDLEPCDDRAPAIPVGVSSETGDESVRLTWIANQDPDLRNYRVYVSDRANGVYRPIGECYGTSFVDRDATNGTTYFYAVTAIDACGNESELSREDVFDTPRPEGRDLQLTEASERPATSGYDFSAYRRQSPGASGTDIYFEWINGLPYVLAGSPQVGLQDVGFLALEGLNYAPAEGWAGSGRVEVTEGHTYAVLTRDGHFAKFHVTRCDGRGMTVDWAFQVARGNRELSTEVPLSPAGQPGGGAEPQVKGTAERPTVPEGGVES